MPIHLRPFNWRLFALHFLAIPLLILGARQLQIIPYASLLKVYQQEGMEAMHKASGQPIGELISTLMTGPLYASTGAVLIGCLLSALIVWHRRESRMIPVLLFAATTVSGWTGYETSPLVYKGLSFLRWPLEAWPMEVRLAVVGGGLVVLGLLPFLLTWRRPQLAHI